MQQISSFLSAAKSLKDLVAAPVQGVVNLTRAAMGIRNLNAQENQESFETAKKTISTANNIFSGLNNLFQFLPIAALSTSVVSSVLHTMGSFYEKEVIEGRVKHLKKLEKLPIFTKGSAELLKNTESMLAMRTYALYASAAMTTLLATKLLGTNTDYEVVNFPPLNGAITGIGLVNSIFFLYFNKELLIEKITGAPQKKRVEASH